jgi:uncharacterized membrane protein YgcG
MNTFSQLSLKVKEVISALKQKLAPEQNSQNKSPSLAGDLFSGLVFIILVVVFLVLFLTLIVALTFILGGLFYGPIVYITYNWLLIGVLGYNWTALTFLQCMEVGAVIAVIKAFIFPSRSSSSSNGE